MKKKANPRINGLIVDWYGFYNEKSMTDVVNILNIVDREGKPFVTPSGLT